MNAMPNDHSLNDEAYANLLRLADGYCCEAITPDELLELDQMLKGNRSVLQIFSRYLQLDSHLADCVRSRHVTKSVIDRIFQPAVTPGAVATTERAETHRIQTARRFTGRKLGTSLLAAIVAVTVMLGILATLRYRTGASDLAIPSVPQHNDEEAIARHVAQFVADYDAVWGECTGDTSLRKPINAGSYQLRQGLLKMQFLSGAQLVVEAPAAFDVSRHNEITVSRGKYYAVIPKTAIGFTVHAPVVKVIDHGTRFGIAVLEEDACEVSVYSGKVELTGERSVSSAAFDSEEWLAPRMLSAGSTVRYARGERAIQEETPASPPPAANGAKGWRVIVNPPDAVQFVRSVPRAVYSAEQRERVADAASLPAYSQEVLADRPLAYWPLEEAASAAHVADFSGRRFQGAVNNVQLGRSGPLGAGSRAAQFDGDCIQLGESSVLQARGGFTVEAWIYCNKVEGIARVISADIGKSHHEQRGWGLALRSAEDGGTESNGVRFTIYSQFDYEFDNAAPELSRWSHVVVAIDEDFRASLYIDGKLKGVREANKTLDIENVPLSICLGAQSSSREFWRGKLAHVAIYMHKLSADRVMSHYRAAEQAEQAAE